MKAENDDMRNSLDNVVRDKVNQRVIHLQVY
jgi:hypothetical protein